MLLPRVYKLLAPNEVRYVREQYEKLQEGKCWYCHKKLTGNPKLNIHLAKINNSLFPNNMFKYPIHLHHSHRTGLTIGAVHSKCNAYMWQYENK